MVVVLLILVVVIVVVSVKEVTIVLQKTIAGSQSFNCGQHGAFFGQIANLFVQSFKVIITITLLLGSGSF